MSGTKKADWTEEEVLALPSGEHDYFERKSGAILNKPDFRDELAKQMSAFANSGGGHIIIGVSNNGVPDGVPRIHKGRTTTREWLEQMIPNLVSYPIEDFRVHAVISSQTPSLLPPDKDIIVIDVGDSPLAPHQTSSTRLYYYREAGHSKPAPHFYLETLRNRLVAPRLSAKLVRMSFSKMNHDGKIVVLYLDLLFNVTNESNVAAYKWDLVIERILSISEGRAKDYEVTPLSQGITIDTTILPSLRHDKKFMLKLILCPRSFETEDLISELTVLVPADCRLEYRVVSEMSRGESLEVHLRDYLELSQIAGSIRQRI